MGCNYFDLSQGEHWIVRARQSCRTHTPLFWSRAPCEVESISTNWTPWVLQRRRSLVSTPRAAIGNMSPHGWHWDTRCWHNLQTQPLFIDMPQCTGAFNHLSFGYEPLPGLRWVPSTRIPQISITGNLNPLMQMLSDAIYGLNESLMKFSPEHRVCTSTSIIWLWSRNGAKKEIGDGRRTVSMILSIRPSVPRSLGCNFNVYDRKPFIIVVTSKERTERSQSSCALQLSVAWRILAGPKPDVIMFAVFPCGQPRRPAVQMLVSENDEPWRSLCKLKARWIICVVCIKAWARVLLQICKLDLSAKEGYAHSSEALHWVLGSRSVVIILSGFCSEGSYGRMRWRRRINIYDR